MADFYIDPDSPTNGAGTEADPFNVWPTIASNNNYYQKRGTSINLTGTISLINDATVTIGAYGDSSFDKPIITAYRTSTDTGDWTEVAANIWEFDTGLLQNRSTVLLGLTSLGDHDNPSWTARVNYLGGGSGTSGAGAFTTFGQWDFEAGSGASTAKLYIYADANPVTKWTTIYYTDRQQGLQIYSASNDVTIENIHFMHSRVGIIAEATAAQMDNLIIQNCIVEHSYHGIQYRGTTNGINNFRCEDNIIKSAASVGIYPTNTIEGSSHIARNTILNTGVNQVEGIGAIYGKMESTGLLKIYDNYVENVYQGLYWSAEAHCYYTENSSTNVLFENNFGTNAEGNAGLHTNGGTQNVVFSGNLITNCEALFNSSDAAPTETDDFWVCDNVGINIIDGCVFSRPTANGTMSARIYNNILVSTGVTGSEGIKLSATVETLGGVTEDYNCVYNFETDAVRITLGSNSITTDPLINSDGTNTSASPCVGTGFKWWGAVNGGRNPDTRQDPKSDIDTDIGFQSTFGPFHPKNL